MARRGGTALVCVKTKTMKNQDGAARTNDGMTRGEESGKPKEEADFGGTFRIWQETQTQTKLKQVLNF